MVHCIILRAVATPVPAVYPIPSPSINAKARCEQYAWMIQNLHNACSEKGPLFKGIKDLSLKLLIYHTAAVKSTDTALFKDDHRVQKILSQTKSGSDLEVMD